MVDRLEELNSASAGTTGGNTAKLLSQRCTLHLERKNFNDALQDAKALVSLLPDAPAGFLKAARCYRFMSKWKAAQKMLDHAAARASDEATLRAIRTETRKLAVAMEQPIPSFIERLPEELFVHSLSYLPQTDIVIAAHVSRRWRKVVHDAGSQLWHTLVLFNRDNTKKELKRLQAKARFFAARLDGASLDTLIFGEDGIDGGSLGGTTDLTAPHGPYAWQHAIFPNLCESGMLSRVRSLYLINSEIGSALSSAITTAGSALQELAFYDIRNNFAPSHVLGDINLLETCPSLHTLIVQGLQAGVGTSISTAQSVTSAVLARRSPILAPPLSRDPSQRPRSGLRRLHLADTNRTLQSLIFGTDPETPQQPFANLEYLCVTGESPLCVIPYALAHLRTLILSDPRTLSRSIEWSTAERRSLQQVETLRIECMRADRWPVAAALMEAIDSPDTLRCVSLNHSASSRWASGPVEHRFKDFVSRHPHVQELSMDQAVPTNMLSLLPDLLHVKHLSIARATLPEKLLEQASSHLKNLETLDISGSSSISSGPLLRLVQARKGQIRELGIEGCTDLTAEAVDWLKKAVPKLRWTGWADRNERRAFRPAG